MSVVWFLRFWAGSEGNKNQIYCLLQGSGHSAEIVLTLFFMPADQPSVKPCSVGSCHLGGEKRALPKERCPGLTLSRKT